MKLAKLSLATIVAVGAMSTFASATPLEEAIKGTEVNGFVKYQFNDVSEGKKDAHKFTAVTDFLVPVNNSVKANVQFSAEGEDLAGEAGSATGITYGLDRANFQFFGEGFTAKLGKQEIATPWTDPGYRGTVGDGLAVAFTGVQGWTFGGAAFVNHNLDIAPGKENLYAIGAVGTIDPVSIQLWASKMSHVLNYAVYGDLQFNISGFSARLQANMADHEMLDESGLFFGGEIGYAVAGFSAKVGYTQNDEKQPIYSLAGTDGDFIFFGKQLDGVTANVPDAKLMFVDLGYDVDRFGFSGGYGLVDDIASEWYVGADYKYSKNFKLGTYYSSLDPDDKDADTSNKIHFEAKYTF